MQTLGVSRFMIEAEPGGRVVFSCLIPLAARQAIAQRFEAEGDDMRIADHPGHDGQPTLGGAKGDVSLRLIDSGALEVTWVATQMGEELGLISGTATLIRRLD